MGWGEKRAVFSWGCALFLALFLGGCGGCGQRASKEDKARRADALSMTMVLSAADVTQVRRGRIAAGPRVSGSTELAQTADVRAELGGQIRQVTVQRGQAVQDGQLLARIQKDAVDAQVEAAKVALLSAQEQLKVARAELQRTQRLVEQGALAPNRVDAPTNQVSAARAQVSQARAALTGAREALGDASVRAPMDGVISERAVDAGDVVGVGALLFTVVDPASVHVEASVPAEFAGALKVGTPVEFEVRGYPERQFHGEITRVNPLAEAQTRQIPIIVEVSAADKVQGLVAGLFAQGRVVSQARQGLYISRDAVSQAGPDATVKVLRDGQIQQVSIQPGLVDEANNSVEILAGLREGEYILQGTAARDLEPGTAVELKINADGATPPNAAEHRPHIGGGPQPGADSADAGPSDAAP